MPGNVHEEKVVGLNIETIKYVPGWCPSVSMMEAGKSVQFDDMTAPDSGRELTYTTAGFWNKYHNRIFLNAVVLTLLAMTYYISYGRYDPDNFLAGIIYGLIFGFIIVNNFNCWLHRHEDRYQNK
ncbi:hypothetical protein METP2_02717 [Methanosarcinales archaeon]|nr:DUF1673 family protein [Candidatus Methanoperedens sp.]CAG0992703.1 hypothetical protein METP2_02717 [Methanosarcinales archaeon]